MNNGIRVLLVDDESRFVSNLARLLWARGFDVTIAFDGCTAVNLIKKKGRIDVTVLDVRMPGMDGIETLRQIKKIAPDMEVIMLTGHADIASGTRAMREGAFDYLMKPCDIEELAAGIKAADKLERIRRRPVLWPRIKACEIITGVFRRLSPEDMLVRALDLFNIYECEDAVKALFVVDDRDLLQGVVAKQDLVDIARLYNPESNVTWEQISRNPYLLPQKTIGAVMRPQCVTAHPDDLISDVAGQMIANRFQSLPVVKDGVFMGVIRMRDVLLYSDYEKEAYGEQ